MIEVKVPEFGESIQEVQISQWLKQVGDYIGKDEDLVELESEKASQALPSPESGIISEIVYENGAFVQVGDVIAKMKKADKPREEKATSGKADNKAGVKTGVKTGKKQSRTASADDESEDDADASTSTAASVMPAARRLLHKHNLAASDVRATGPGGRLLKEDVLRHVESSKGGSSAATKTASQKKSTASTASRASTDAFSGSADRDESMAGGARTEERKPMSMIRRTIAARLVEAQSSAALLTTFNEIDMQPVMELRSKYKDAFEEKHGVKLGFMSFFAKASVEALKRFPAINSRIDGNDVVHYSYCDIGIAIGGGKGLVVPVLRNVEQLSFARIERQIGRLAELAQENRLQPDDLEGGTFTISNGGVYGSLLSTPIVNPPQSGILGLHAIQKRPVAIDDQVVIRPMMYVALTYDHRIVDGREAVQFLKTIKEVLEEPARLFLEV